MSIKQLSEDIINQIAAGEVIENPSAVIKELVENSIDSGADTIEIDIENSGLNKIIVKDNGSGIREEDLEKAPKRHATSKITSFEDLYSINSMGFRGEALASIFSISKAKIISKHKESNKAFEISSKDYKVKESGGGEGTSVHVEEIFHNTPARKKYLKSERMELKSILDTIRRFELFNHKVKLTLKHNGKILVNKPKFNSPEENILYILGKDLKGKLFEINSNINWLKIKGFVGKPAETSTSYRKNQYIFVNGRYVKSKLIDEALYDGVGSNLMDGRHPFYVLYLEIDPEIVDVNVHPTKIEIRFENELEIYTAVKEAVDKLFETQDSTVPFEKNKSLEETIDIKREIKNERKEEKNYFTTESQKNFEVNEEEVKYEIREEKKDSVNYLENSKGPLYEIFEDFKVLGQLNKTYIIVQTKDNMYLVDQHIAEEKYFYELFKENFKNKNLPTQKLLKGEIVHLDNSEKLLFEENREVLETLGFRLEEFGANEILVREVPITIRNKVTDPEKVKDFLHELIINKKIRCVEEENYEKLASMACRISIMAGDELTIPQMRRLIENLRYLKQPFNCPHGRPTLLKYPLDEINRKFKR